MYLYYLYNHQPLNYYSTIYIFAVLSGYMPTPVAAARQCLSQESAAVLDEAVAVARRRGHAQTTSLHMVTSLLSVPNSSLREACTRTRGSGGYATRVQFKALELSLSVSLDRLPSSQAAKPDAPPVSNSLMAAIKRSQANQRRQPENFSFYQQQQQQYSSSSSSSSSVPLVRVELQNLIVSILDDPLVSRVLAEAGFRSCDIKMATLRPGNILGYTSSRYKRHNPNPNLNPPLFLCNLTAPAANQMISCGSRGFSFPFMGCFTDDNSNSNSNSDSNTRRIGEVMLREKKRSPLLLGASATHALADFLETARGHKVSGCRLPDELSGLVVESVTDEISRYLNGDDHDDGPLKSMFEKVKTEVDRGRVLVDFGDMGALLASSDDDDRRSKFLVGNMGRLVELYGRKLWLIGTVMTYEVYFKILNRFPSIEEEWQLGVLPITSSIKFSMGGSYPRSSLMESFVPLGGFFSMPVETKSLSSNTCQLCNEKYEQEVAAVSNAEKHQPGTQNGLSFLKGTDDKMLLTSKMAMLQKKWDNICIRHHHQRAHDHHIIPRVLGFQVAKGTSNTYNASSIESLSDEQENKNASSTLSTHPQTSSSLKELTSSAKAHYLDSSTPTPSMDKCSPTCPSSISDELGLEVEAEPTTPLISNRDNQWGSGIVKDPKLLYKALLNNVGHQEEAISSIVQTISEHHHGNIWINVQGGDALSKKKLGLALAEILYSTSNNESNLVYIDLSFPQESSNLDSLLNSQITSKYDVTMRATVVDYLVDKLSKKQPCVVFLDNLDKADLVVQNSLLQAVRSSRFTDWCGREANVANSIFIGATKTISCGDEDDVVNVKGTSMEIVIRFDMSDDHNSMNKRKLAGRGRSTKRPHKALDLNLNPNEEGNAEVSESDSHDLSRSWLEGFDREVDLTVDFKEFDFVKLGEEIVKSVEECVKSVVECECAVEIEEKAKKQMMGAAYLCGMKCVEDWIDEVVRKGFVEGMGKYSISGRSIVTIKAVGEEQSHDQGLLPTRITMK